jgi:hypothetical protein
MLPQLCKLIVKLVYTTLRDTYVLAGVVGLYCTFACSKIGLCLARRPHEIIALHGKSFA